MVARRSAYSYLIRTTRQGVVASVNRRGCSASGQTWPIMPRFRSTWPPHCPLIIVDNSRKLSVEPSLSRNLVVLRRHFNELDTPTSVTQRTSNVIALIFTYSMTPLPLDFEIHRSICNNLIKTDTIVTGGDLLCSNLPRDNRFTFFGVTLSV